MQNPRLPRFLLLFSVLFLSLFSGVNASLIGPEELEKAKNESRPLVFDMIQFAEERDYSNFARRMVFTGRDGDRAWRDYMNYADPFEMVEVENTANKIRHWVTKSEGYELKGFRTVNGLGRQVFVWDIAFIKKGKEKVHGLYFFRWDDEFLLCRID